MMTVQEIIQQHLAQYARQKEEAMLNAPPAQSRDIWMQCHGAMIALTQLAKVVAEQEPPNKE